MGNDCQLKRRSDDIPKLSKREKSWHCDRCGALLFAEKKPDCVKHLLDAARVSASFENQRLHIEGDGNV